MANNAVLSGNLSFLNLAELLQLLGSNTSTGVLRITTKYASEPGVVFFNKGNPVHALNGRLSGLEAIFSLFGWSEGEFAFGLEDYDGQTTINKSRMEIILDGLRKLDDGEIERLEPVAFEKADAIPDKKKSSIPVIKGPLVDYLHVVDEEEFFDGEEIIIEGNHGNWIWVILEGTVELSKATPDGPITFLQISDGAFIGSLSSLLADDSVRNVTATAVGNVQLGMLDSQGLGSELGRMSAEFQNLVRSVDKRYAGVMQNAVNTYLQQDDAKQILKDRRPVIMEGKNDDKAFVITGGNASVVRKTETGIVMLVSSMEKGDVIGPIPFLDMGLEPASAIVMGDPQLKVTKLDRQALIDEFEQLSSTFKNILENLSTCILATAMVTCEFKKKRGRKAVTT
jgi:CRP-like cAMP-binding protein